jgi:hypothetical protein
MEVLQVSSEQLRRQLSELLNQVSYNGEFDFALAVP